MGIRGVLAERERRLRVEDRLARAIEVRIESRRARLSGLAGRLHALSPLATLERGYAIPLTAEGRLLRRVRDFETGSPFQLRVHDGTVEARVEEVHPTGDGEGPTR
jgi:exodeoxyribonuclease VII large subunit